MKYRKFGGLDCKVSVVGFGGGAISGEGGGYGFGDITESQAIRLLHAALDAGINVFDTAPCYGLGTSEFRMGKAFKDRRDQVFLVSKSGVTWDENKRIRKTNDPKIAKAMLEQSLRDLQTDCIDLYMIHWPDDYFDIRDTWQVLIDAKKAGKVRYLGLANSNAEDFAICNAMAKVDVFQSNYSLFDCSPETTLFPLCEQYGLGFMSYGTLDKGILTGRVSQERKYDKTDVRHSADWWKKEDRSWKFSAVDKLKQLTAENNLSLLELAVAANLDNNSVSTALVGAKNDAQLATLIAAAEREVNPKVIQEARAIVDQFRPK